MYTCSFIAVLHKTAVIYFCSISTNLRREINKCFKMSKNMTFKKCKKNYNCVFFFSGLLSSGCCPTVPGSSCRCPGSVRFRPRPRPQESPAACWYGGGCHEVASKRWACLTPDFIPPFSHCANTSETT